MKLHDLRHETPTDLPDVRYVMQYREPVGQLLSYVEMLWKRDPAATPIEHADYAEYLVARLAVNAVQFLTKWGRHERIIPLRYGRLIADPAQWVERMLAMLGIAYDAAEVRSLVGEQVKLKPATLAQGTYRPHDLSQPVLPRSLVAAYNELVRERTPFIDWPANTYYAQPCATFPSAYEAEHARWLHKRSLRSTPNGTGSEIRPHAHACTASAGSGAIQAIP